MIYFIISNDAAFFQHSLRAKGCKSKKTALHETRISRFHETQSFPKRYANRTYNRFLLDIRPFVLYHRTQEAFVHIKRQAVKSSPRNGVMRMDSINATLVLLIVLFYLISHKQK